MLKSIGFHMFWLIFVENMMKTNGFPGSYFVPSYQSQKNGLHDFFLFLFLLFWRLLVTSGPRDGPRAPPREPDVRGGDGQQDRLRAPERRIREAVRTLRVIVMP